MSTPGFGAKLRVTREALDLTLQQVGEQIDLPVAIHRCAGKRRRENARAFRSVETRVAL